MPILNVQIMQGYAPSAKTALLKSLSQAVVDSIGAPVASVRITLAEVDAGHVIVAGELGKDMALIIVDLIAGRTPELKSALISALNQAACESLGISGQDVRVVLHDVPKTDMGVANGLSAAAAGR
ncbi:tautomerase family protein [Bordetella holmesii]|uniref:4-oxalocrotonate tautomerase family enzyme n=2 Tax=Bordetella holmesii TaxID=35814 RepID=A0A158M531_9BORD|nr:tautomerase family protein [Bordetella holmesii]AHV94487.1 4-oxalocrotonate tautomerase enzyme family protein [Bordetella holmesii ATCC 51541]AIT25433.1 4-oxalocrotonate tautomerase enzyme family protein [Bordetella holmesii 44057]EWM48188.1 4-oxalocrotonate tautomerase enzyme family protein [Bordetella holmesii 41130]EWM50129.1 4-oxalocrotonate tautomerase enzyme family protein [Bordetella holmesii 35009]AMD44624.1 4-oxalocrotonate tautomerase [Bordetella holmesii H558]